MESPLHHPPSPPAHPLRLRTSREPCLQGDAERWLSRLRPPTPIAPPPSRISRNRPQRRNAPDTAGTRKHGLPIPSAHERRRRSDPRIGEERCRGEHKAAPAVALKAISPQRHRGHREPHRKASLRLRCHPFWRNPHRGTVFSSILRKIDSNGSWAGSPSRSPQPQERRKAKIVTLPLQSSVASVPLW